ncbi:hypothetical protein HQ865_14680 [Mucilaginibacter mali]|uniref:MG2 domain-containing protein n=1 Tax=Mucilaginibacter mali TaxID=2740462 RepID=A0A7D4UKP6_9SPHI|nr:hypothetical protein [Mucilaginibacter mali]QKJ30942.1 hypothetical protein HQ865_14680 [Mucilaginibacter mali]
MLRRKHLTLLLIMLSVVIGANAQNTPATPSNFKLFFEKIYLHTDRDTYVKGDTLWFKAYLTNAQTNKPIKTSGTLYVDLIAPDAHVISTEFVRLNNGSGNADIELTDTLAAGKYRLRAYTNWMKNFGDAFIYEKEITIVDLSAPATPVTANKKDKKKASQPQTAPIIAPALPTVRFFPEGGSMIAGISSLIAVKAEDANGKGIPATGAVISAAGDTIARFKCDDLGMGLFALLPAKGQTYSATAKVANKQLPVQLPAVLSQGLALQVKQTDSLLHVVISNTSADPAQYTLTVKHSGQTIISQALASSGLQTAAKISSRDLPEGIVAVALYDTQGKPNCERLVYIHHPDFGYAKISTDKRVYAPFEKTTVQFDTDAGATNLSVAVVDAMAVPQQADDILSYLMLGSELHGHVEQARRYFDANNANRFKQLDLLLLTQGWRDFIWRRLTDTTIHIDHTAEKGISLSGFVKDEVNHKAMPALNVSLYASGLEGTKLFATRTDTKGHFIFADLAIYDKQFVKLSSINLKGDSKGTVYVDTFFTLPVKPVLNKRTDTLPDTVTPAIAALIKKAGTANQLKGVTNLKEVKITANKNIVTLDNGRKMMTWGDPQIFNITPQDNQYRTLTWFLQQRDKRAILNDANRPGVAYMIDGKKTQPLLMINGSMFHIDKELYFNMPIEKYKRVEVTQLVAGSRAFFLISAYTKQANPLIDNPGYLGLDVQGYYQARTFYKPVYEGEANPPKTDMRTTIHWQPYLKTDADGKATFSFYNTSGSTTASIIVQGIKDDGTPISEVLNYEVKQ